MSSDDQATGAGPVGPDGTEPVPEEPTAPEEPAAPEKSTAPLPALPAEEQPVAELDNGRYQLVERVGAGSIGQVWRARDLTLQREVAIKTVNLATSADPSTEARFRREAVATAGLDHPNVVQIYDSGVDGHTAFLVMEFLRGPNLQSLVNREGPIPFKDAVPLLAQVAAGLGAAHAIGVTHRDVKPANVVLDSDSLQATPKLVDFGIARLNDQGATALTSTMTAIGSAAYMSPEQASGERVNSASDLYSLGCLMTTVITGHPPFPGESPIAVARAQVYDTPTPLRELRSDCPVALDALVAALLAKNPAARPNAKQTEAALLAIAADPDAPPTVERPPVSPEANSLTREMTSPMTGQPAAAGAASTHTSSLVPTTLQSGNGAMPGSTDQSTPKPTKKSISGRTRRIVIAAVVLLILATAVWLAWAQGRREVPATPSSTVTMTETHSATATPTPAQTSDTTTDTAQTGDTTTYSEPTSTATGGQQPTGVYTGTADQTYAPAAPTDGPQATDTPEPTTSAPNTSTSGTGGADSQPSTTSTSTGQQAA